MSDWLNVSSITPRIAYTATAGQTAFTIPFVFFDPSDIKAYRNDLLLTLATHYTLSPVEQQTGTLTLLTGATVDDAIMIVRDVEIAQTTHIPPSGPIDVPAVNIQISKLIAIDQQNADDVSRSLRLPDSTDVSGGLRTTAPVPGEYLKWNAAGNGVESTAVVNTAGTYAIATQSEAGAGTRNDVLMTPLRTAQAFSSGGIITGDGSDQTAVLQAMVTALPVTGGQILLNGTVSITALDLQGRRNIRLVGSGGQGGGAGFQPSSLIVTAGAIGVGVAAINCKGTNNVSFSRLLIQATNAAFNGVLIEYGGGTGTPLPANSAYMSIDDCALSTLGASASSVLLSLYGATDGQFNKITFGGPGRAILLQTVSTVGFCNGHVFSMCTFTPSGVLYPILGSGEGLSFIGCVFEPGSDGVGRAWQSYQSQMFKGVSFTGCWFGDSTVAGGIWLYALWGNGLSVTGCSMSGNAGSYGISCGAYAGSDPQEGGVRGVSIMGNYFNGFTAAITFDGTIVAKTNARGVIIGGNSVTVGFLFSGIASTEQVVFLPNSIYSDPLTLGTHFGFWGLPAYANRAAAVAAGLGTGQVYQTTAGPDFNVQIV